MPARSAPVSFSHTDRVEARAELRRKRAGVLAASGVTEALCLLCEEAFFLSAVCGVLEVRDSINDAQSALSPHVLWTQFCEMHPAFPVRYAAYQHLRACGWVPKSGLKFGCDFMVYRVGPQYRHADAAVIVTPSCAACLHPVAMPYAASARGVGDGSDSLSCSRCSPVRSASSPGRRWTDLVGAARLAHHTLKGVVQLTVLIPPSTSLASLDCLSEFSVCESGWERIIKDT